MAEEHSNEATDDRPKFFKSMTAWVGGATALIVALGGLATAFGGLLGRDTAKTNSAQQAVNASDVAPESTEEDPTSYTTGDGGTLRWVEGMWVWTDKDGTPYRYKEVSNDGVTTVAVLRGGGEDGKDVYLRWPNAGGQALQSFDDRENWNNPVEITEVPAEDAGATS
jgi:hypothetical protein